MSERPFLRPHRLARALAEKGAVMSGEPAGMGHAMGQGDIEDRSRLVSALQRAADGVQAQGVEEIARALVEGDAKCVLEFASAHVQGEAKVRDAEGLGKMCAHPGLGPAGEADAVAIGFPRLLGLGGKLPAGGDKIGDETRGIVRCNWGEVRECVGGPEQVAETGEAAFEAGEFGADETMGRDPAMVRSFDASDQAAAFPDLRWDDDGHAHEAGIDRAIDGLTGRQAEEGAFTAGKAMPGGIGRTPHEGDGAPTRGEGAVHARLYVGFVEVEGPAGALELLDAGGKLLGGKEIGGKLGAGEGEVKAIRIANAMQQMPEPRRWRMNFGHDRYCAQNG